MKTLDEVIKANECCDHGEPDSRCEDCPYNGIGACCAERESDALHYLKDMKNLEVDYDILYKKYWREFNQQQANPALTWEQLQSMEGKPVWVEANHAFIRYTGWALVGAIDDNYPHSIGINLITADPDGNYKPSEFMLLKDFIGNTWQAYRKERDER